ncbi:lipid A biosynthesis lauroyl acyltransferase [Hartmannibacter diazotrophicus]|uniref:Lipid A biosynthesis lauroyl acyltransferase n=2 Tax=Hartmannibacter diazotrophicus TaxID=1482074 RepID=A0A2C9D6S5_9HYPH|nr:lipid A biosynthesis lauroyl acyltransferase [Hartmannibacter diazotrophicus]
MLKSGLSPDQDPASAVNADDTADGTASPTLADRLEYWALRAVLALLSAMSVDRASALMGWLWRKLAPFNHRHKRADANIAAVMPHLSRAQRRRILDGMWDNLGRVSAETIIGPDRIAADRFRLGFDPDEFRGIDFSKGAVFASLHAGNWELATAGISAFRLKAAAVYRKVRNPLVEAMLLKRRVALYPAGLLPRESATPLKLGRLARAGAAICLLADLRDNNGLRIDFLGRPAWVSKAPAFFARRFGLPLMAARVVRENGVHFRAETVAIPIPKTDDLEDDIAVATRALNACFEDWIRQDPEQWMWGNRKWLD